MGSSASFSSAISAFLLDCASFISSLSVCHPSASEILEYANLMEKHFHTNPSGCDTRIVVSGGLLKYSKSESGEVEI